MVELKEAKNTDRELWRETEGDYYSHSIHVTEQGNIGINCGGYVFVKPVAEWHKLAMEEHQVAEILNATDEEIMTGALKEYGSQEAVNLEVDKMRRAINEGIERAAQPTADVQELQSKLETCKQNYVNMLNDKEHEITGLELEIVSLERKLKEATAEVEPSCDVVDEKAFLALCDKRGGNFDTGIVKYYDIIKDYEQCKTALQQKPKADYPLTNATTVTDKREDLSSSIVINCKQPINEALIAEIETYLDEMGFPVHEHTTHAMTLLNQCLTELRK
jgi:DNA repair exonuclease SbcCD ATPase subunit